MKRIFLILTLTLTTGSVFSQASDHLEPVEGYFHSFINTPILHTYYERTRETLFKDIEKNQYLFRILALPSFQPEKLLSVEYQDGGLVILKRTVKVSVWSYVTPYVNAPKQDIKSIKLIEEKIKINEELAKELQELFIAALSKTQYPKEPRTGFDGESYFFMAPRQWAGVMAEKTWSPENGTKMHELMEVSKNLENLFQRGSDDSVKQLLLSQSKILRKKFKEE